jgi:hypothetical protein
MKSLIFVIVTSLFLFSCGQKEVKSVSEPVAEVSKEVSVDPSMSNPELFLGSGVGPAFMSFVKTQNFEMALQFTAKESIDKYGREVILDKYKSLNTNYTLKRASTSKIGGETTLRYTTNEFATSKFKDFVVVVENDSCKILLPNNLDNFLK